jgi:hypothetical protein
MAERFDTEDRDWPSRPWIMAAIGAAGGLVVHLLTDGYTYSEPMPVWKQAATAFTVIATISFLLTVELRRWTWSIAFAVGWGAVIALVGWFTAQYNRNGEIMEFPFLSGILAVLIAAPLFQTIRDEGAWRFPYARLHRHAWTDAVIGAASLAFTGVTFMLAWLIASLFNVIGIEAIKELLQEEWFSWMLAGLAFGGAIGILRERDALAATLQKLAMVVLSVLAPVLAVALAAFLLSLPFTGLKGLWESDIPATPMLLLSGAGAILLANSVIGDGREERSRNIWMRRAALLLVACVLPLAFFAALSMGQRIGQYGWTPERIWGVVAVAIALAYGAAAWWAVIKGRMDFDDRLRPLQTKLAIGLCGLALLLALPIVDFGAISAKSQLARLESGKIKAEEFDWAAMAFDFGPAGRRSLERIAGTGPAAQRQLAATALKSKERYRVQMAAEDVQRQAGVERRVRLLSPDIELTPVVRRRLASQGGCTEEAPCSVMRVDSNRLLVVWQGADKSVVSSVLDLAHDPLDIDAPMVTRDLSPKVEDFQKARIEIRTIERRQAFIDGKPVGDPFE